MRRTFSASEILAKAILLIAFLTSGTILFSQDDSENVITLDSFSVEASSLTSYRAADSISATGINAPILDVPISISVLTEGRIVDNNAFELHQIMDTVPTVRTAIRNESSFSLRGFSALSLYRNGHYRRQLFPTWNIDRVEVIKGPSAIFHGQARPGGVINYITKRPSFVKSTSIRTSFGAGDIANTQYRGEITTTGPINDKVAYRVGAGYWKGGDWHLDWRNREYYVGGSLKIEPNDKWSILFDFEHIDRDRSDGETLVQPFNITEDGFRTHMPDFYFGGRDRRYIHNIGGRESFRDYTSWTAETEILFEIAEGLVLRQNINYSVDDFEVLRTFVTPERDNLPVAQLHVGNFANWRDNYSYDTALVWDHVGDLFSNTMQIGFDFQTVWNETPGFGRRNGRRGPVFRYNMATGEFPDFPDKAPEYPLAVASYVDSFEGNTRHGQWNETRRREEKDNGFYVVNMTDFMDDKLRVLWGARYVETSRGQWWDSQPAEERDDVFFENTGWVPQVGFNLDISEGVTFYSVYSESVERNTREDADGVTAEPIESSGYDIGFKFDLPEKGIAGTVNYWLLNRGNQTERDTAREELEGRAPFFFFGLEQETAGFEVDLSYMPMENWQMNFTYSYFTKFETVASLQNPQIIGQDMTGIFPWQMAYWTRYNFSDDVAKGLSIGGGFKWFDDREDRRWLNGISEEGRSTTDIFIKYRLPSSNDDLVQTIGLNINNLFDEYDVTSNAQAPRIIYFNYTADF